jgi:23S rRNA pseudouridine1911/1915/1917 synthase
MVKVSSSDILAILRRYKLADEDNVPRHIEQVKFSNPHEKNTLISFRFNKQQFYILFDETGEDDKDYILEQIRTDKQDVTGGLVQNPNDHTMTYGLPFRGKEIYLYAVKSPKIRLDILLPERFPDISRSTWQKHVKAGHVSVNGEIVESPKQDVLGTDAIIVSIPEATDYSENMLPIIYLDENVIVINKPIGVLTHSKGALNDEFTVADFFRRYTTVGLETNRPGIIHRLDRDTSGVMIGARNPETATMLQKQFADRKTKKTYLAVVDGLLKNHEAKIDLPIDRNPSAPSTFRVDIKGKSAVTSYTVLATTDKKSLVELRPLTGRTHQLRVHMSYLKAPIHGDRVYGKVSDRLYLHAAKLEITIPTSNRQIFTAPVPPEFTKEFPEVQYS